MTQAAPGPAWFAALHEAVFVVPRPFTEPEFADFLASPAVFTVTSDAAFAMGRLLGDEAELLTLAVAPARRRQGIGRGLLTDLHAQARVRGAVQMFLEVDETNRPARGLYAQLGYAEVGRRKRYYRHPDGHRSDALILTKSLTPSALPA